MKLSEIANKSKQNHFVLELFSCKRMFGPQATIGIIEKGKGFCRYGTITALIESGHVSTDFSFLEPFFMNMPKVCEVPQDEEYDVFVRKFNDGGPQSPWDTAKDQMKIARVRAERRRRGRQNDGHV